MKKKTMQYSTDQFMDFQIFRRNMNCRKRIFSNILTSIDRMHHSKRNLRVYELACNNNNESIQMITALVLQLIQSSTDLPKKLSKQKAIVRQRNYNKIEEEIMENWETSVSYGEKFLQNFYSKYQDQDVETDFPVMLVNFESFSAPIDRSEGSASNEVFSSPRTDRTNIRQLFKNFVNDLLTTVNRPEWPASDLLLNLLGAMLVKSISNKSPHNSMRFVSLEYLGTITARMRKFTIESRHHKELALDELINIVRGKLDHHVRVYHIQ